jgi:hypothetical protein
MFMRSAWATRWYGTDRDVSAGAVRDGFFDRRVFYGPNAERKAARDRRRRA